MPEMSNQLSNQSVAQIDYGVMLDRARALVPALQERAARTEKLRGIPGESVDALHRTGLFRALQPRRVGGSELDYVALVDIAAILAEGDASVGWVFGNLASHHWMLAMFPERAQATIWDEDRNALIASSFVFPAGRATRVDGGYRIGGRWPFSSGVGPSTWNILGGIVTSDDAAAGAEYRIFLVNHTDYTILDTWDVAGLGGTGSNDIECKDLFVPDHMTLAVSEIAGGPTPGSDASPGALYELPVFALFPFVLSGAALGNAQGCLEAFVEGARVRASRYNLAKLADFQAIQIKIASASAKIDAARKIMRSACIDAMAQAREGRIPDLAEKTRYRRDGAFSVGLCTEAVSTLFSASGAGGLYMSSPMQRQFRDAHAISAHIAFNFDAAGSNFGRVALGLASENPTL
ncbi:MAG: acyl-CoA dehydrogenase [Hyphomicrobiales bacterium]|nr:acyl-CoA dehydrogenase [Hyphomicrobiales bacterium]